METLYSKGDMCIGELQEKILSSTGTIPLIIKNLSNKNFVERIPDPKDKRRFIIHLTDEGRKVIEQVFPQNLEMLLQNMETLSDSEKENLLFLLKKLNGLIKG